MQIPRQSAKHVDDCPRGREIHFDELQSRHVFNAFLVYGSPADENKVNREEERTNGWQGVLHEPCKAEFGYDNVVGKEGVDEGEDEPERYLSARSTLEEIFLFSNIS